jgi:ComF family protein
MLVVPTPRCRKCGGGSEGVLEVCNDCLSLSGDWDQGFTVWHYSGGSRELIHKFKYRGYTHLTRFFAEKMHETLVLSSGINFDLVTFVPMHWLKKLFRGYNQSELLARELALLFKIPCKKSVVRVKLARQQALLNRQARIKNIKNIFKLKNKSFSLLENKHILIVDDVFTTGSTFKEMARQLHFSDVASITIISIARG